MKANNFTDYEFFRHLSDEEKEQVKQSPILQRNLEELRALLNIIRFLHGKPIIINSWYRDQEHNKMVGGSATSQHLKGEAADITSSNNTELLAVVKSLSSHWHYQFGQIIQYGRNNIRFIHISLATCKHKDEFIIKS